MKSTSKTKANFVIFHGFAERPEMYWLPWVHAKLEDLGYPVWAPALPNPIKPNLKEWLKATRAVATKWDENTIIIGHSLGGTLALRLIETVTRRRVRAVITVGTPFASMVNFDWLAAFFDRAVDWRHLRTRAMNFVTIQSKNDPLVPYDHALRYREMLEAKLIMTKSDGHFIGLRAPTVWREIEKLLK